MLVTGFRLKSVQAERPRFLTGNLVFQNLLLRLIGTPVTGCSSGRIHLIPTCAIISFALYSKYAMAS